MLKVNGILDLTRPIAHKGGKGTATANKADKEDNAEVKRRPSGMLMRENKGFFSFAFDSAHVKCGI